MRFCLIFLFFLFLSCSSKRSTNYELISYYWSIRKPIDKDSLVPYVRCRMYAQIDSKGNCILTKSLYRQPRQFIKYQLNLDSINEVLNFIDEFNNDTSLVTRCSSCIYDGPIIKIINHKVTGDPIYINFNESERSNQKLLRFYRYLDTISLNSNNSYNLDTIEIINAEKSLVAKIFELEKKYVPIVLEEEIKEK